MNIWRWIDTGYADGTYQMATDWALLEHAAENGMTTMRMYGWKPYCISLGYNQSSDCIDSNKCRENGIDIVRRPTGGRAVLHAEEVTYSVIIPEKNSSSYKSIGAIYNYISRGLARGIQKLCVPANLKKRSLDMASHYRTQFSVSCFSAAARHEVLVDGKKLVGSAQRRLSQGVLQHGSILTGDAHQTLPEYLKDAGKADILKLKDHMRKKTVSLGSYLEREVNYSEVADAVKQGMEEELGITFKEAELTESEKAMIPDYRERFKV